MLLLDLEQQAYQDIRVQAERSIAAGHLCLLAPMEWAGTAANYRSDLVFEQRQEYDPSKRSRTVTRVVSCTNSTGLKLAGILSVQSHSRYVRVSSTWSVVNTLYISSWYCGHPALLL